VHKTIRSVVCHDERAEKRKENVVEQRVPTCAKCTKEDKQPNGNAGQECWCHTLMQAGIVPSVPSPFHARPSCLSQIMELNRRETFLWAHATISS
jgi:hypothetical protein